MQQLCMNIHLNEIIFRSKLYLKRNWHGNNAIKRRKCKSERNTCKKKNRNKNNNENLMDKCIGDTF